MSAGDKVKKRRLEPVVKLNKRLCKETRVTPWRDGWELESVGRGLLSILLHDDNYGSEGTSTTNCEILKALDMVNVWKARSHALEALPQAVESTAALTQVLWRDQQDNRNRRSISTTELRLAYSSAIVRCINGFADALQQQRFVAAPISILCGQLGIPSWLVDIRHEASHNELPTLPVLKLAAITLLEYLHNEYWIPTCPQWNRTSTEHESPIDESNNDDQKPPLTARERAINILLDYQQYISKQQHDQQHIEDIGKDRELGPSQNQSKSAADPRPFDTFFGDRKTGGIYNDRGDDDEDDDDDDDDEFEDPILGNFWGSSIGTNANRFAVLEPPKKVKPQPKQKPKPKPKKPKKPPLQKKPVQKQYHVDYGCDFVMTVSPLEGYSILVQFFVWGGIGGLPEGQGALVPTAPVPVTQEGFQKSQQQYLPLLEVIGRAWPGFGAALLTHLVDCVLAIEGMYREQESEDTEADRKLFFLGAWIRVIVSQQFVFKVYPELKGNAKATKAHNKQTPHATFASTQALCYPLNSLCDRIVDNDSYQSHKKTSKDILQILTDIVGPNRTICYGIEHSDDGSMTTPTMGPSVEQSGENVKHVPDQKDDKLSLDDIEALLSDDDKPISVAVPPNVTETSTKADVGVPTDRRMTWIRCTTWDTCSIGTLPGHPV